MLSELSKFLVESLTGPSGRRARTVLVVLTALGGTLAASPPNPPAQAAGSQTGAHVEPPPPTPPNPAPPRPQGKLVPAAGALFGIHTTPDAASAKAAADMGITAMEADFGRTFDIDNHYYVWDQKLPTW